LLGIWLRHRRSARRSGLDRAPDPSPRSRSRGARLLLRLPQETPRAAIRPPPPGDSSRLRTMNNDRVESTPGSRVRVPCSRFVARRPG
jgi:hypothetical protein